VTKPISPQKNKTTANTVETKSRKLASIIKTTILCGRQNIALCDNRDNSNDLEKEANGNHGKF